MAEDISVKVEALYLIEMSHEYLFFIYYRKSRILTRVHEQRATSKITVPLLIMV
jgi:hypothetical protein